MMIMTAEVIYTMHPSFKQILLSIYAGKYVHLLQYHTSEEFAGDSNTTHR